MYRDFENAITAQGLTHIAWRVLAVLHDAALSHEATPGVAIGQLAHDVLAKQPTVTKLVQRMAEEGLVALHADPADQRRTLVTATPTGQAAASALIAQARQQETTLLARWSASEAEAFKRHLQKLASGQ
nr:MarR family winged helix-turn-helix transcriptional regulator [Hydrogenophaga sp. SL48]